MANREFFFLYAPTWDYPPGGPIRLGNVITSVKNPHRPLFCSLPPEDSDIFKTEKKRVHDEEKFAFEALETTQFTPTSSYVQTCVEAKNVRHFLELSKYRKPVYIITGLKVVTGAQANTLESRSMGGTVGVEVDVIV
ncbi:hypothetical protein N0V84_002175 [Fusarium piperis]|uniref:Uncharacterized protein n=1 Tax=Fusarium piperis TaxID=1435070 RepID=A0A9W8WK41_9HYPO|nr:hypothetical protein N0V84_002175 [Fusarium piperis]